MKADLSGKKDTERKRTAAVVLAAGSGLRMGGATKKQFLMLKDYPLLYYSLKTFEESFIDEVILIVSLEDIYFCQKEIVGKYGFNKVKAVVAGGRERYNSVLNGLRSIEKSDYVFIHDAARPFITQDILERAYEAVKEYDACVVGMPSKDTVKLLDGGGFVESTPQRSRVWTIQTPQVFKLSLIREAYEHVVGNEELYKKQGISITDDAMVLEAYSGHRIKPVEGSYANIKVTTPEDMDIAEGLLNKKTKEESK